MTKDPQLWKYRDHQKRADRLIAEGKPLSIHFDGKMYVHSEATRMPCWIGNTYVWLTKPIASSHEIDMVTWAQDWRRRLHHA